MWVAIPTLLFVGCITGSICMLENRPNRAALWALASGLHFTTALVIAGHTVARMIP